jgi:hypothetical protein
MTVYPEPRNARAAARDSHGHALPVDAIAQTLNVSVMSPLRWRRDGRGCHVYPPIRVAGVRLRRTRAFRACPASTQKDALQRQFAVGPPQAERWHPFRCSSRGTAGLRATLARSSAGSCGGPVRLAGKLGLAGVVKQSM